MRVASHVLILLMLLFVSCIDNDLPYPVVIGKVTKFELSGQISADVNVEKRVIQVVLADTVDIENVYIKKFDINNDAIIDIDTNLTLNLSKKLYFTVTTYQKYSWQIDTSQPIERSVRVQNQIGTASIDALNKIVIVYVNPSQDVTKIKIEELKLGASNAKTVPKFETVTNFVRPQLFFVKHFDRLEEWKIYVFKD